MDSAISDYRKVARGVVELSTIARRAAPEVSQQNGVGQGLPRLLKIATPSVEN
jgi:hypothetical protein